jgi:hypothetical protein
MRGGDSVIPSQRELVNRRGVVWRRVEASVVSSSGLAMVNISDMKMRRPSGSGKSEQKCLVRPPKRPEKALRRAQTDVHESKRPMKIITVVHESRTKQDMNIGTDSK